MNRDERDTISVGSCPTCGGPVQFIANPDPASHASGCAFLTGGPCHCSTPMGFREALAEGLHKAMCYGPTTLHNRLACERPLVYLSIADAALEHPAIAGHNHPVRRVELPNIDENLGGGWRLTIVQWTGHDWHACASRPNEPTVWSALTPPYLYVAAAGDSPSAAYLTLRSAIEARS